MPWDDTKQQSMNRSYPATGASRHYNVALFMCWQLTVYICTSSLNSLIS